MINWDDVTAGETEIVNHANLRRTVVAIEGHEVWLRYANGDHGTYPKEHLKYWTIYDPWEDVSEQCEWIKIDDSLDGWVIIHNNGIVTRPVMHNDPNYKSNGRRVWKRKEGRR